MSKALEHENANLALVGFRYDENSSFMKGASEAPPQIRAALRSEAWNMTSESGTDLSGETIFFDAGDIEAVPGTDMLSLVENSMVTLLNDGSEDEARAHFEALQAREPSAPLPRLADQFWNQYSMTASVKAACAQLQPQVASQAGPVLSTLQSLGVDAGPAGLC